MAPQVNGLGNEGNVNFSELSKRTGISEEALKQMDAEALTKLINSVELSDVENSQLPQDKSEENFAKEEKNKSNWLNIGAKALVGAGIVGATIATIISKGKAKGAAEKFAKGAAKAAESGAAEKALKGVAIAAVGGVAGAALTGCQKLGGTININNNYNVSIPIDIHNHINLDDLKQAMEELSDKLDEIIQNQQDMEANQLQQINNQQQIIRLIGEILSNQASNHQGLIDMLGQIFTQLQTMDIHQQESTIAVLNAINDLKIQNAEQHAQLMNKLDSLDLHIVNGFANTIAAILEQGGNISEQFNMLMELMGQVQTTLDAVLAAINNLDANMQEGFQNMLQAVAMNGATLEEILAMLQNIKALIQQGNAQNQQYFQNIINGIGNLNTTMQQGVAQILSAIGQLDSNMQGYFLQLLDAIVHGHGDIQALLTQLLSQVTQLNTKMDEVIAAIRNLDVSMQAGFEAMMGAVMQNGATLEEILAMLEHIKNLVTQVSNQVQQGNAQNQQLLTAILTAIQNMGADMQDLKANVAQILAKLDTMDANQQNAVLQMIQHMIQIENGQDQQNQNLQTIINLINGLDVGGGSVDLTPILNAINNLNNNVTQQAMSLGALVAQVLGKLDSIDNKVGVIQTIAQNTLTVAQHVDGDAHIIIGLLNKIIENQDNQYNNQCPDCCEEVIALLEQILAALTNGTNDEGFDGTEYDDLFS